VILWTGTSRLGRFARGGMSVDNDIGDVSLRICYKGFDRHATSSMKRDLTKKGKERIKQSVCMREKERKKIQTERDGECA